MINQKNALFTAIGLTALGIIRLLAIAQPSQAKPLGIQDWQSDVQKMLGEFLTCGGPTPPNTPCNVFTARALKRIYNISDFNRPGTSDQYLTANEMATYVKLTQDKWTALGNAASQKALDEAQGYANAGKAIIAVYEAGAGHGHVAIIVPGSVTASGQWGLKCPNSASFFLDDPAKSYISKPMSYAFSSAIKDKVLLYGRNY